MSDRYTTLFRILFALALVAGTYLALTPVPPPPPGLSFNDKLQHAAGFAVLAFLLDRARPSRRWGYWQLTAPLLLAYGGVIELLQGLTPYRFPELLDFLANGLGIALYGALRAPLARVFRPARADG